MGFPHHGSDGQPDFHGTDDENGKKMAKHPGTKCVTRELITTHGQAFYLCPWGRKEGWHCQALGAEMNI